MLTERKMAGAGIQNNIDSAFRHTVSRATSDPCVFTDLKSQAHVVAFENKITDGPAVVVSVVVADRLGRPRTEPARLVMQPVTGQMLLRHKTHNLTVSNHTRNVVHTVCQVQRQTDGYDHVGSVRHNFKQHIPCRLPNGRRQEHIFTAVTGDAQFRQTQHAHVILSGVPDGLKNAGHVAFPVQRRLIQDGSAKSDSFHSDSRLYFLLPVNLTLCLGNDVDTNSFAPRVQQLFRDRPNLPV